MNVFKAWEEWADYPKNFLLRLQHTFLGIAIVEKQPEEVPALLKGIADTDSRTPVLKHDIYNDGMPLNTTEDIDGVPMQSSEEKLKTGGPVLPSTPAEAAASVKRPFYRSKPAASPPIGEDSQNGQITGEGHAGLSTNCWSTQKLSHVSKISSTLCTSNEQSIRIESQPFAVTTNAS
ncbi:hypothetical protein pipiens_018143 [Culex pipiens pipiens]|uniref:Gar2 n=1 Tax=Culex pipiens pipiens TaxID=38569 RepID=A0ABD1CD63_CULPP